MNRLFFVFWGLCLAIAFTDCTSEIPSVKDTLSDLDVVSMKRSASDAMSIARQFSSKRSVGARSSQLEVDPVVIPIMDAVTRGVEDTLLYAVNFKDDNGFLLVSASKATTPILAMVEEGAYNDEECSEEEAFEFFIDRAKSFVRAAETSDINTPPNSDYQGEDLIMMFYTDSLKSISCSGPRVNVKWGPYWPENLYCSNRIAGCIPVAVAQMMSYFKDCKSMDLTFNGRPMDKLWINWEDVTSHVYSLDSQYPVQSYIDTHISKCQSEPGAHYSLGAIVRQIGELCDTKYNENGTFNDYDSGPWTKITQIFNNKSRTRVHTLDKNIYDGLVDGGVGFLTGVDQKSGRHFWTIDGVGLVDLTITTYYYYNPKDGSYKSKETERQQNKYVHCNWGRWGRNNGYFLETVFDTTQGVTSITRASNNQDYNYEGFVWGYIYK